MEFLTADVHAVTMMKLRLALPHLQRQALAQLVSPQGGTGGVDLCYYPVSDSYLLRPWSVVKKSALLGSSTLASQDKIVPYTL